MYLEPGQKPPLKIKLWGLTVKLLNGRNPILYSFAGALPRLPVPSLEHTTSRWLEAMIPLQTPEELENSKKLVQEFVKNEGPKLQRYLIVKSWVTRNYVSDWWEKYIYLRGRSSLMINSNYYGLDQAFEWMTNVQVAKAANFAHEMIKFAVMIDRETVPPMMINGVVPICMSQISRMFSTTRIPGKECDVLQHWDLTDSKFIVVVCNNIFYRYKKRRNYVLCYDKLFFADYTPFTNHSLMDHCKRGN